MHDLIRSQQALGSNLTSGEIITLHSMMLINMEAVETNIQQRQKSGRKIRSWFSFSQPLWSPFSSSRQQDAALGKCLAVSAQSVGHCSFQLLSPFLHWCPIYIYLQLRLRPIFMSRREQKPIHFLEWRMSEVAREDSRSGKDQAF